MGTHAWTPIKLSKYMSPYLNFAPSFSSIIINICIDNYLANIYNQ